MTTEQTAFDLTEHEELELAAIRSLARVTQVCLAYLNAVAWLNNPDRKRLNKSIALAVKENSRTMRESLHWQIEHSKRG